MFTLVTLLLTLPGQLGNVDEAQNANRELQRSLALANRDPSAVWDWTVRSMAEYASGPDRNQSFQFEIVTDSRSAQGGAQRTFHRFIADGHGESSLLVAIGTHDVPFLAFTNDKALSAKADGWHLAARTKWGFVADGKHVTEFLSNDDEGLRNETGGYIRFVPGEWLTVIMRGKPESLSWDAVSRTLSTRNSRGTSAYIAFRSPEDTQLCGEAVRDICVITKSGTVIAFRNLIRSSSVSVRPKSLVGSSPITIVGKGADDFEHSLTESNSANVKAGQQLWDALWPSMPESDASKRVTAMLSRGITDKSQFKIAAPGDAQRAALPQIKRLTALLEVFEVAVTWLPAQVHESCPEDPSLQWRRFEQLLSPLSAQLISEEYLNDVLKMDDVPLSIRCRFASSVSSLGAPPFESRVARQLSTLGDRDLIEATVFSRWGRPCAQRHVDACVEYLKQAQATDEARECVTETLIRLHRINDLPAGCLADWYVARVLKPKEEAVRWRSLVLLTASNAGRNWAQNQVRDAPPAAVKESLQKVLHKRASAAQKAGRFENLSEEECRRILSGSE